MEISYNEVKNIADTLPIGFYARDRITLEVSKDSPASYYSPLENKINLSYLTVLQSIKKLPDNSSYLETAVRCILYHEVSHAMLTPLMDITDVINIFEDERIETLLAHYYHNVDFKRNIFLLNDYQGEEPKDTLQQFYHLVRFRKGKPEYLAEVNRIIEKYSKMNRQSEDYWSWWRDNNNEDGCTNPSSYIEEIYDLYNKLQNDNGEKMTTYGNDPSRKHKCSQGGGSLLDNSQGSEDIKKSIDQMVADGEITAEEGEAMKKALEDAIGNAEKEVDKVSNKAGQAMGHVIEQVIGNYYDQKLTDKLEMVINNFNKKNSGGSAVNAYSGVFNPRAVTREDYRYFQRKTAVRGNNSFGTFHLNLFIDDSGSMSSNEELVNKLIYSLLTIERHNANFSFDMITCADRIAIVDKTKGYKANGGTHLTKAIIPLYNQVQRPGTYNYNIVLFDGDCSTDKYLNGNTFLVFNNQKCTIISDPSNRNALRKNDQSNVVISENYTQELLDNVYNALQQAFR